MKNSSRILVVGFCIALTACGSSDFNDLDDYMAEKKARPGGHIKPIPPFQAYKAFTYSAAGLRSPFEKPVQVKEITRIQARTNVTPDENRTKEYLEQFGLDSLKMVGTLLQTDTLWVLMQDQDGGVHRVKQGNFMGRNHGKIVEATDTYVSLVEIVSNGLDGWIERPRTIKLKSIED